MPTSPLQALPYPPFTGVPPNGSQMMLDALVAVEKQLVMKFATAAARDATVTAPVEGMLAYLTSTKQWSGYDGTKWRNLSQHIEFGTVSHAYGGGVGPVTTAIVFAQPFSAAPAVFVACNSYLVQVAVHVTSATGVTVGSRGFNGVAPPAITVEVSWMAVGLF